MGQIRHGSASTTHAIRAHIQRSQASIAELSRELGINPKTVAKWRKRTTVEDHKTGPKEPRSTVLSADEEAMVVAFRRHTLLALDDCLYALQPSIPHLSRSSLHRCLQRHGISRLPDVEGDKPAKKKFKSYPLGYFHVDIAEVQTAEGKLRLFVAIDRTSMRFVLVKSETGSAALVLHRARDFLVGQVTHRQCDPRSYGRVRDRGGEGIEAGCCFGGGPGYLARGGPSAAPGAVRSACRDAGADRPADRGD